MPKATKAAAKKAGSNTKDKRVGEEFEGRCMSCRENKTFQAESINTWANGMEAAVGPCPKCGTKINRILGKAK